MYRFRVPAEVAGVEKELPHLRCGALAVERDACIGTITITVTSHQPDADPVSGLGNVAQQGGRPAVIVDHEVRAPIVVKIADRGTAPDMLFIKIGTGHLAQRKPSIIPSLENLAFLRQHLRVLQHIKGEFVFDRASIYDEEVGITMKRP